MHHLHDMIADKKKKPLRRLEQICLFEIIDPSHFTVIYLCVKLEGIWS